MVYACGFRTSAMKSSRLLPLIVACGLFVENMDSTVLSTSLPAIAADLATDPIALKLALTTYLLALAVFIPVSGWVADRFGARSTFVSAIAVFLLGSVGCALSDSLGALVAGRFVQGMGGAMMVPVGRLVLLRSIPKSEIVQALSWVTIPALVGPMVGPPLGGFITTYFDWRWIFLINLPIGALGMILALRFIPNAREQPPPLDWFGFALAGGGLGAAMFGFSTLGQQLVPFELAVASLVLGLSALVGYVVHERRHEHALLDLDLFRLATYRAGVVGRNSPNAHRIADASSAFHSSTRRKLNAFKMRAASVFMKIAPIAETNVRRPDCTGLKPKPTCNINGNRNGVAPTPMRNTEPPTTPAR